MEDSDIESEVINLQEKQNEIDRNLEQQLDVVAEKITKTVLNSTASKLDCSNSGSTSRSRDANNESQSTSILKHNPSAKIILPVPARRVKLVSAQVSKEDQNFASKEMDLQMQEEMKDQFDQHQHQDQSSPNPLSENDNPSDDQEDDDNLTGSEPRLFNIPNLPTGRIDFELPANSWRYSQMMSAMTSHTSYWGNPDVAMFVLETLFPGCSTNE